MTIKSEEKDGRMIIEVNGSLTIMDVTALHLELIACFGKHEPVTLDIHGVADLDTAGIQLLVSACMTAEKDDREFSIDGMSDRAVESVNRAGMKPEMLFQEYLTGFA